MARAWRETKPLPPEADLGNVVAFRKPRSNAQAAPVVEVELQPSIVPEILRGRRWICLVVVSAAVHLGLYLPFLRDPPPTMSLGEQVISIDIVLGDNRHAGATADQGTSSESAPAPAQAPDAKPSDEPKPSVTEVAQAEPETVEPASAPPAVDPEPQQETAAQAAPNEPMTAPPAAPVDTVEAPAAPAHVLAAPSVPTAGDVLASRQPEASVDVKIVPPAPKTTPVAPPAKKPDFAETPRRQEPQRQVPRRSATVRAERNESRSSAPAQRASRGAGPGASMSSSDYRGLVQAQLRRYTPSGGQAGSAAVSFTIGPGGGVGGVRLSRSSGNGSLDSAVMGMVRRASPFPAPPGGRAQSFTIPVNFR